MSRHWPTRGSNPKQREIVERILRAWSQVPELRLGQLWVNATMGRDDFYVEDDELASWIEDYVKEVEDYVKGWSK